jgi:hypothetical protein
VGFHVLLLKRSIAVYPYLSSWLYYNLKRVKNSIDCQYSKELTLQSIYAI